MNDIEKARAKKRADNFSKSLMENIDALNAGYRLVPDQETGLLSAGESWEKQKELDREKKNAAIEKAFWNRKKL